VSGPGQLSGDSLVASAAGRVEVEAEQPGDNTYQAAKAQQSVTVVKRAQQIQWEQVPNKRLGEAAFRIKATASSGLAVGFSVVSGPAQIRDNEVNLKGAGPVVIKAAQPGDEMYAAAEAVCSFEVAKGAQTIQFEPAAGAIHVGESFTLQASASSGLAVGFSVLEGKVQLAANRLSAQAAGRVRIKATQRGNDDYEPAEAVQSFTIIKASQKVEFKALSQELFVGDKCNLEAVASSGLAPVTFSVVSGKAVVSGHQLTLKGPGPVVLKSSQPGSESFEAAEAEQTLIVQKAKQTVRFEHLPQEATAGQTVPIEARASSGLAVSIEVVSGPAEIVEGQLVLRAAGEVKLRASQAGDENYAAAPE